MEPAPFTASVPTSASSPDPLIAPIPAPSSATPMLDELVRKTEEARLLTIRDIADSDVDPKSPAPRSARIESPASAPSSRPAVVNVSHQPKSTPPPKPITPAVVGVMLEPPPETQPKADPKVQRVGTDSTPPSPPTLPNASQAASVKSEKKPDIEDVLEITEARFCRRVHGFGSVDPLLPDETPKPGQRIWLYAELVGVGYNRDEAGFRSRIASRLELFRATDQGVVSTDSVWVETAPDVKDLCRHRRRDFFVNYVIRLPKETEPGKYVLRLSVTDLVSNRIASSDVPLSIAR